MIYGWAHFLARPGTKNRPRLPIRIEESEWLETRDSTVAENAWTGLIESMEFKVLDMIKSHQKLVRSLRYAWLAG